jgi:hypothetical protein
MSDLLELDPRRFEDLLRWTLKHMREMRAFIETRMPSGDVCKIREVVDDGCLLGSTCMECGSHVGSAHNKECPHYISRLVAAAETAIPTRKCLAELAVELAEYRGGGNPHIQLQQQLEWALDELAHCQHVELVLNAADDRKALKERNEQLEDLLPWLAHGDCTCQHMRDDQIPGKCATCRAQDLLEPDKKGNTDGSSMS